MSNLESWAQNRSQPTQRSISVLALLLILGCAGGGAPSLSITCSEFLTLGASDQEEVIAVWTERDSTLDLEALRGTQERENMRAMKAHCAENPDDRLRDLEGTWRMGY